MTDEDHDHDEVMRIARESTEWPERAWETFALAAGPDHVCVKFMRDFGRPALVNIPRSWWPRLTLVVNDETFSCKVVPASGGGVTISLWTAEMLETFIREFTVEMT